MLALMELVLRINWVSVGPTLTKVVMLNNFSKNIKYIILKNSSVGSLAVP
jgi:hypothetical protein